MSEEEIKLIDGYFNKGWCCDLDEVYNTIMKVVKRNEQLEKELEPIHKLGIPVKTVVAELNRLEDLEDDREQLKQEIEEIEQYSIPKAEIREMLEELDKCSMNFDNTYWVSMGAIEKIAEELLGEEK